MSVAVDSATTELAKSGESLKSGPLGLAVILVLCVASYFLFKSMSKHLKRVREEFPTDSAADWPATPVSPAAAARQAAAAEAAAAKAAPQATVSSDDQPGGS
ncbi:hypothetical protein [Jatrophihabitans sp.]|uniref:hypothetical protein n=1 Tax=Jatrophihabitans sp. TaxID=1932789 RepID=UPI0030C70FE8|nr:hypothetical protein [Jatrophihabitans sp.]